MQNTPIFEENGPENFKGIDIMRAVRCSTRASRAACTCTPAGATCARSCTPPPGWPERHGSVRRSRRRPGAAARAGPGSPGSSSTRPARWSRRGSRRSSSPVCSQLYGAGLERILASLFAAGRGRRAAGGGARRGPAGRDAAADPRLAPGRARGSGAGGTRVSVRPYMESHGGDVELLSLRDGVAPPPAGKLLGLRGFGRHARAGDQAGARRRRSRPRRSRGRGRRAAGQRCRVADGDAEPTGLELPVVISPPPAPPSWFEVRGVDVAARRLDRRRQRGRQRCC